MFIKERPVPEAVTPFQERSEQAPAVTPDDLLECLNYANHYINFLKYEVKNLKECSSVVLQAVELTSAAVLDDLLD